ncbi:MAG TPA: hypothetical protein VGK81_07475 [Anaerolineae bacterium]
MAQITETNDSINLGAAAVRNRVLVLVALIALTPVVLQVVELPTRSATISFLGSALSINLSADSLLLVLMPVLACAGADWVLRDHPDVRGGEIPYLFPFWVAPAFAALTVAWLLTRIPAWPLWIAVLLIGVTAIATLLFAEYVGLSPYARGYAVARLLLTSVSYAIAFSLFTLIYSSRDRSVISATISAVVAFGLALDLMAPHIIGLGTASTFSLVVGLIVGESTWALNYWNISNWSAGVLLLAVLYVMTGLAQQYFQDRLTRSVLVEFGVVAAIALVIAWQLASIH